jgi:hypothetical protein
MPMPWPSELPQQFEKDGYQDAFADNRQNTQTDLGPMLIRSRYSSMPRKLAGVMKMNKTQLIRLRKFWKTDTLDGKLPFLFPDPVFGYGWRRNWIPNSGYAGAVAGNPGTLPTGWSGTGLQNGINKIVAGVGMEGDLQYVDLHFAGTASGTGVGEVIFAPNIAAKAGETWTESAYLRMIAGGKDHVLGAKLITYNTPNTANGSTDFLAKLSSLELKSQRYANTWVTSGGTMTGVSPRIQVVGEPGIFMDITIRVAGVQMEKADYPTEFMFTPNDANPIARFQPGGRPPSPIFLGGVTWGVNIELEIFET